MTFDQNHGASELTGEARDLFEGSVNVGIVKFARDRFFEVITARLVGVCRIRVEVDAYGLRQDRRFGRGFAETGRRKGSDALVGLMGEGPLLLNALDDRKIHDLIELDGSVDSPELAIDIGRRPVGQ